MLILKQEDLQAALNAVTRASSRTTLMAAFSLVRLEASLDGTLALSCFNGESAARALIHAACAQEMSVCVDAQTLKAMAETLTGEIRLEAANQSLLLQSGANRTALRITEQEFPIIADENGSLLTTIPGSLLRSLLRVIPFACTDEARPALHALHLTFSATEGIALGTDGFTAGQVVERIQGPTEEQVISLPLGFASLLAALVEARDTVQIHASGPNRIQVAVNNPDTARQVRLETVTAPAEAFPAAQIGQLIKDTCQDALATLKAGQASLAQTLRMVGAMKTDQTFIKTAGGAIKMASAETEVGQARNLVEGTASGAEAQVWLSAAYLKRANDACKDELTLLISGEKKPVLLQAGNFSGLIMPILSANAQDPFACEDEAIPLALPAMAMPA